MDSLQQPEEKKVMANIHAVKVTLCIWWDRHDNARPHIAKSIKTYLETVKWEVLPHPPYSQDIAPSDYYLFRSMAHCLVDQQFCSYEDIEKWFDSWIGSKDEHFYRNGNELCQKDEKNL
ncbi:hypothetical protein Trydic_g7447 [Trypoxylus dichotomus]